MPKYLVTRDVTREECPWLEEAIPEGTIVYRYYGHTYGVIGNGIAVSLKEDQTPFFELPYNSIRKPEL